MIMRYLFWAVLLVPFLFLAVSDSSTESGPLEKDILFPPCPDTPNCVSSLAKDPARRIDPLPLRDNPPRSMMLLIRVISSMPRVTIVSTSPERIEAEFRSILGFVDDVLFVLSAEQGIIHVRSSSRKGSWDLGVNRRRVERIRRKYLASGI
jgi:uncharacterized protein (DUF1499 family)